VLVFVLDLQRRMQSRLKVAFASALVDYRVLMAIFDSGTAVTSRLPEENALRHFAGLATKRRARPRLSFVAYVDGCAHCEIAAQLGVPIARAWVVAGLTAKDRDIKDCE
jgi:hypothetical protein